MALSRAGGIRTPDRRFWRPMLYQLSYCPQTPVVLARLLVTGVFAIMAAVLAHFEPFTVIDLALDGDVVPSLALGAFEGDLHPLIVSGHVCLRSVCNSFVYLFHLMILTTRPAPTVRPPSRIAKRKPSSIAIGFPSSTVMVTLSPGITISVPAGNCTVPVTSVVRKKN